MIPVIKTVETELADAQATIARLEAAMTPDQRATAQVIELRALVGVLGASEASLLKQVATLTQEHATQVATLTQENATLLASTGDIQLRASRLASDIASSQGVPALNVERGGGIHNKAKSRDELHVAYAQIADPNERAQFWLKHEAAMMKKD